MFTVIVTEKGGDQKRLDFDKPEITIGRVQGNDIILPKGNVSKRHSRIVLKDGKFIIVDLKSTNGTYVNGRKITSPLVVKDSDKIYIGDFIITVEEPNGASVGVGANGPPASAPPLPSPPPSTSPPPSPMARKSAPLPPQPASRAASAADDDDGDDADDLPAQDLAPVRASGPPARATGGVPAASGAPLPPPPAPPARSTMPPPPLREPLAARPGAPPPAAARETGSRGALSDAPPVQPPMRDPASLGGASPPPAPGGLVAPGARRTASMGAAPPPPATGTPRLVGAGAHPAGTDPVAPPIASPLAIAPRNGEPDRTPVGLAPASAGPAIAPHAAPVAAVIPIVPTPAPAPAPPDPKKIKTLELQREIHDRLVTQLELARIPIERLAEESLWQRAESVIVDLVEHMDEAGSIPAFIDQDSLIKDTLNETLGLGPLEDLLADDSVAAILVNRHDRVLMERGGRLEHCEKAFSSEVALRQVIDRLVAPTGRRAETLAPILDLRLPDGARLTAVLSPLATRGPCLTLRKPRVGVVTMDDLVRASALSKPMADFLGVCVAARKNIVVCGGQGAAKAHVLAALSTQAAPGERIVSIEDVAELSLGRDAWIALEGRLADDTGKGGVSTADLLRAAKNLRPDRLVVGEVTGAEAHELLLSMASSHEGTLAGVAAEGARAALTQLETLARLGAGAASAAAVRGLVAATTQVIVHVARYADGAQRVTSISEVTGLRGEDIELRDLFQFQPQGRGPDGVIRGRFAGLGVIPRFYETLEARGIPADTSVFK